MANQTKLIRIGLTVIAVGGLLAGISSAAGQPGGNSMSFFVTSGGPGDGGNLGGSVGADAHCQSLANAVGAGDRDWRAYLSTVEMDGQPGVDARDRIGIGPWHNAEGVMIAANLDDLHSDAAGINKQTALSESGKIINGRGDSPNQHDILTGTLRDGTAADATCLNWTSSGNAQSTYVGHTDLIGNPSGVNFWNYSHATRGCSQSALVSTGGAGLLYCFAAD